MRMVTGKTLEGILVSQILKSLLTFSAFYNILSRSGMKDGAK